MSRNPILTDKAFDPANHGGGTTTATLPSPAQEWERAQAGHATATGALDADLASHAPAGPVITDGRTMTIGGTAWATLLLLVVAAATGVYGWSTVTETPVLNPLPGDPTITASLDKPGMLIVALLGAFVLAMVTAFVPKAARFTGLGYAALEGFVLGAISHLYDAQFNGIVVQAILGTAGVFIAMLALYGLRILRVTPRMTKAIIGATFGILVMYGVAFIASLFGVDMGFVYGTSGGGFGIVLSLVIVGVASFNLLLDFDFIENGSKSGLPAYMEWYGAFGLMVTLVWIYIEMLRLFARLRN
ncbi:MAG: Bax inhibitor-1/YccA family protein [Microthrixaceae bacterium]|nr:Bax inhibitor-1/YccA family protein [Microthrixaceae bacterium]